MRCHGPGCKNQLTGKQRFWCSDRCRKRAKRANKKASGLKLAKSGKVRDFVGHTVHFSMVIRVKATQQIPFMGHYSVDNHLREYDLRVRYARLLERLMNELAFGHQVTVEVRTA